MGSPAPWLRWTQTQLTRWRGEDEEEEEEDDDFERRMDEDGVIGLGGEGARSPPWGDSEELEEGSPAEEGRWHPRRDPAEEDEERGSSGGDEGPWGAESDGEPYPELSSEGRWGSGSSGSPEAVRDGRALCQPRGCGTDGGDTSGLSDTSPDPGTPSRQHRDWGTAGDTIEGRRQERTPRRSLPVHLSPSPERVPEPQTAGTGMPAPGTAGSAPTGHPQGAGNPPAPQGHGRSRAPKKAAPAAVPPKPGRQSRSLSPRRRTGTEGTQYGRGRLNHPLPDLSKVEARVKFDQSYRPPRGRVLPARPRGPGGPIGFKSPAEIVREVLLSSGEGVSPQPPSTAALPQEFSSPRQATALVQQLQDDYHKLLTKYAEAENTIDQLRLGARRMRMLKDAQDALEREYLRGRQQLPEAAAGFDPDRYKHFKSLPESLSLEQLSLAESGSQGEVEAPTAGDGGHSNVPCRTRSLEEGPNLETLPVSGTGSAAAQHGPRKEQRIVSPETDSGFVGSEASRVSPPAHSPEQHPPGPGTPGSLGTSIAIPSALRPPRKREETPLPSETALMGIYSPGGSGGPRLPPSSPSQSSSPPRWPESAGSDGGPDPEGDGTHTDSEVGGRSCASAGGHPAAMARSPSSPLPSPETPSPTLLSPDLPSLEPAHCDLLGSRLERDQAIRALQDEVWRLRLRLEESLRRSRSYPEGKAAPRVTPARRQPVASGPSSPQGAAPSGWVLVVGLKAATLALGTLAVLTLGFGRDMVPGGDTACHPGTPRRAGHLGVSPMSQGQDGISYCSPAVPTSAPALAGVPLGAAAGPRRAERPRRPQGHRRCLSLELEELEELNWSLRRAVEAAQSVRLTTTRMSRALAAELGRERGLRGSCLF
ncbi:hypothetical protein DUI87_30200 [Hirundo rustica rustica]|uniref:AKNA domain-containing protein n=1 Tax=Hirundo rustica rustica TaxID=333673 RepID=A0A3M0IY93_HIRRU|nr:hypothetical protein DUI87_30200 [Hirundo rustica rustica]